MLRLYVDGFPPPTACSTRADCTRSCGAAEKELTCHVELTGTGYRRSTHEVERRGDDVGVATELSHIGLVDVTGLVDVSRLVGLRSVAAVGLN